MQMRHQCRIRCDIGLQMHSALLFYTINEDEDGGSFGYSDDIDASK